MEQQGSARSPLPEKRKLTKYRAAQLALERNMRETWATGLVKYSQLCICRGRIYLIANKDTGEIYTEMWGSGVYLHLHWFGDMVPPTVKSGKMATVVGNIQTFNLNAHVSMRNCLHVPKYGAALGREVRQLIAKSVLAPKTYVPAEQIDAIQERIRDKQMERIKAGKSLTKE